MRFQGFDKLSKFEETNDKTKNEEEKEEERQKLQDKFQREKEDKIPIYKDSPFYEHYSKILEDVKHEFFIPSNNEKGEKNKLKSLYLAKYIVEHFMTFAPMWTAIIIQGGHYF